LTVNSSSAASLGEYKSHIAGEPYAGALGSPPFALIAASRQPKSPSPLVGICSSFERPDPLLRGARRLIVRYDEPITLQVLSGLRENPTPFGCSLGEPFAPNAHTGPLGAPS